MVFRDTPGFLSLFVIIATTGRLVVAAPIREYAPGSWSQSVYDSRIPEAHHIAGVGLVNDEEIYFGGRSPAGIFAVHRSELTQIEAVEGEITTFHLCHHRSSIFYEVLSPEGGDHSIFEYSLISRSKKRVRTFQDRPSATSLACLDRYLLRTSAENLLMIPLMEQVGGEVLEEFHAGDAIASLSVRYAADVFTRAEVFGVVPTNRSVIRLRFTTNTFNQPRISKLETVLSGGDGNDGVLKSATVKEPHHVLCMKDDQVIIVDGCSVRQLQGDHVRTLLGTPGECETPAEEHVEPVPWSSRISRPLALAGAADGTASGAMLLLTGAQVISMSAAGDSGAAGSDPEEAACATHQSEGSCVSHRDHGCGWTEGDAPGEKLCLSCTALQHWAWGHACDWEGTTHAGTRYALAGCGCVAPEPEPDPDDPNGIHHRGIWILLVIITIATCIGGLLVVYRAHRRAAIARELYGGHYGECIDTAEFHTFTDDDCPN